MEKFGLFNIIEKLAPFKKSVESNLPSLENLKNFIPKNEEKPKQKSSKKSTAPALDYIRRHQEMSRRIDQKNKT